jgi:hypothetical protein
MTEGCPAGLGACKNNAGQTIMEFSQGAARILQKASLKPFEVSENYKF